LRLEAQQRRKSEEQKQDEPHPRDGDQRWCGPSPNCGMVQTAILAYRQRDSRVLAEAGQVCLSLHSGPTG
jgi:hypothetical protein